MNCLVTQKGKVIECSAGVKHDIVCQRQFGYGVNRFLEFDYGLRIKTSGDIIAIEYYCSLSDKQKNIIRRYLRQNDFYTVILCFKTISKFRPIRSLRNVI